jgi:hypothetical protein
MPVMSALLVGTVMGVCVLGTTLLGLARNNKYKVVKNEGRRKTSHVTELLQVDMVDRRIRMTSIDCTLDMDLLSDNSGKVDHVISPMVSLSSSVIH